MKTKALKHREKIESVIRMILREESEGREAFKVLGIEDSQTKYFITTRVEIKTLTGDLLFLTLMEDVENAEKARSNALYGSDQK